MGSCGSESEDYPTEATSGARQAHHQVPPACERFVTLIRAERYAGPGDPSTPDPVDPGQGLLHVVGCDRWVEDHRVEVAPLAGGLEPAGHPCPIWMWPDHSPGAVDEHLPPIPWPFHCGERAPDQGDGDDVVPAKQRCAAPGHRGPHVGLDLPGIEDRRADANR